MIKLKYYLESILDESTKFWFMTKQTMDKYMALVCSYIYEQFINSDDINYQDFFANFCKNQLFLNETLKKKFNLEENPKERFRNTIMGVFFGFMENSTDKTKPSYNQKDYVMTDRYYQIKIEYEKLSKENYPKDIIKEEIDRLIESAFLEMTIGKDTHKDSKILENNKIQFVKITYLVIYFLNEYNMDNLSKNEFLLFLIFSDNIYDVPTIMSLINEFRSSKNDNENLIVQVLDKVKHCRIFKLFEDSYFLEIVKDKIIIKKEKMNEFKRLISTLKDNDNTLFKFNKKFIKKVTQKICYGAPGTGKSYAVNKLIENESELDPVRTVIYPDYDYSDFTTSIRPKVINDDVTYDIYPGPFALAMKKALENPNENVFLVIEEMTRGNVAAIFGDIFQLLDRNDEGESEYPITNCDLAKYLLDKVNKKKLSEEMKELLENDQIKLPNNLSIIGTVNTSDQNVFTMDTAFKRRFEFEYVSTDFIDDENNFEFYIAKSQKCTWKEFIKTLNNHICSIDDLSDDKCLGQFFIKGNISDNNDESIIEENTTLLRNKLLHYLYEDVEPMIYEEDKKIFNKEIKSFNELYKKFGCENVFNLEFNNDQKETNDQVNENDK